MFLQTPCLLIRLPTAIAHFAYLFSIELIFFVVLCSCENVFNIKLLQFDFCLLHIFTSFYWPSSTNLTNFSYFYQIIFVISTSYEEWRPSWLLMTLYWPNWACGKYGFIFYGWVGNNINKFQHLLEHLQGIHQGAPIIYLY